MLQGRQCQIVCYDRQAEWSGRLFKAPLAVSGAYFVSCRPHSLLNLNLLTLEIMVYYPEICIFHIFGNTPLFPQMSVTYIKYSSLKNSPTSLIELL